MAAPALRGRADAVAFFHPDCTVGSGKRAGAAALGSAAAVEVVRGAARGLVPRRGTLPPVGNRTLPRRLCGKSTTRRGRHRRPARPDQPAAGARARASRGERRVERPVDGEQLVVPRAHARIRIDPPVDGRHGRDARLERRVPAPSRPPRGSPRRAPRCRPIAGSATGTPRTSALIRAQVSSWLGAPGQPQLADRGARGDERLRDVAQRERRALEDGPGEVRPAVLRASGPRTRPGPARRTRVPARRRGRAGTRGRPHRRARDAAAANSSSADQPSPVTPRIQSTAAPSAAIAPPTTQRPGQRRGRHEQARDHDLAVRVDPDAAGRPAGVHRVARRPQARPEHRRRPVVDARRRPGSPGAGPCAAAASGRSAPSGVPNGSGSPTWARRTPAASRSPGAIAASWAWSVVRPRR